MSATTTKAPADPELERALERFFSRARRPATEIHTRASTWDLYLGDQYCYLTQDLARQIVVNVVTVREQDRRKGVFTQGMRLLLDRFAPEAGVSAVVLDCIHNPVVYKWALRQPGCFVSATNPTTVYLYVGGGPLTPRAANMANTAITIAKVNARADDGYLPALALHDCCFEFHAATAAARAPALCASA